jgi:Holliday junction resolvase RusA-like endonuclease
LTFWRAHVATIRGKGRPRFAGGRAFTDPATRAAEAEIATLCRLARGRDPITVGWVVVGVVILDPIPPSWSAPKQARAALQEEPAAARPDCDNAIKLVLDGAAGVWFQGDAKVLPAVARGWTADAKRVGMHLYLWPAATPCEAYKVVHGGAWSQVVASMLWPSGQPPAIRL